jgi:ABC-type nickel/cobalt efflux system permease component RcnA
MRKVAGAGAAVVVFVVLLVGLSSSAAAHPLGNFTVNRFSGLHFSAGRVVVDYVVDMAEIPTFQVLSRFDRSGAERVTAKELQAYADHLAPRLLRSVRLTANDRPIDLTLASDMASLRPGQGGLDILRIQARFVGSLQEQEIQADYRDRNYAGRIGWKEIVATADDGEGIVSSSVPAKSISDGLRAYPKDLLSNPLDVTGATLRLAPRASMVGGRGSEGGATVNSPGVIGGWLSTSFASLVEGNLSPAFVALAILLAFAAGAAHALAPGHGKGIMAAYLVGTEGRLRHAVGVGAAISLMHTLSVAALGLSVLWASSLFPPETVYPWLSLLSGILVLALGAGMLHARLRNRPVARRGRRTLEQPHDAGHAHGPGAPSPTSLKGLGVLAVSGGLLPSPSALVVLLAAVALHRVLLGVILIGVFSVGLAATLSSLGIAVVKARSLIEQRSGRGVVRVLPLLSAAAITVIGVVITVGAITKL